MTAACANEHDGRSVCESWMAIELSFCVVNTEQRQLLRYCLDAIARERATVPFETEVLVLDNASRDGSAEAARAHPVTTRGARARAAPRQGENDTALLRRARGRFCLLLNEDSELEPGATVALHAALDRGRAPARGATLVTRRHPARLGLAARHERARRPRRRAPCQLGADRGDARAARRGGAGRLVRSEPERPHRRARHRRRRPPCAGRPCRTASTATCRGASQVTSPRSAS